MRSEHKLNWDAIRHKNENRRLRPSSLDNTSEGIGT